MSDGKIIITSFNIGTPGVGGGVGINAEQGWYWKINH